MMNENVLFTTALPTTSVNTLEAMAKNKGVTASSVMDNAIQHEWYLRNQIKRGAKLIVRASDGSMSYVDFVSA